MSDAPSTLPLLHVIDHAPHAWCLLQDDAGFVLDVNCSRSFVGFSAVLRLAPDEAAAIARDGRSAIDALACAVQQQPQRFATRIGDVALDAASLAAIRRWQADR